MAAEEVWTEEQMCAERELGCKHFGCELSCKKQQTATAGVLQKKNT